ncbi:MAG: HAD family hydrolase [Chloroflexota bacterium]|nr:HAD family hydrolase [Chloroflexota bacterium]
MSERRRRQAGAVQARAVVFDLFNTLTAPVDDEAYRASVRSMGMAAGVDPAGFSRAWFDQWRERSDGTFATTAAVVRGVCEAIGARVDVAAVGRAVEAQVEFSRRALRPREDAVATLGRLRERGLRTALVSNCAPDVPELWPTTPYAELIDEPLFSCVERLVKPDANLYLRACTRLGVQPASCVYVGDGDDRELTGAAQAGMRAMLVRTPAWRAASFQSERASWPGEAIESLSHLPGLIASGEGA